MLRVIREVRPKWILGENVLGIVNWSGGLVFDEVQSDLEAEGYEVQAYVLPACAVNAPHRRDRVWFVAHAADPTSKQNQRHGQGRFFTEPAGADEQWLASDPTSEGREERQQVGGWANSAKNRTGLVNGIERPFDDGFAPDPRSVGMSGQPTDPGTSKNTGQGRESVAQDGNTWSVRRWEGFPTTEPTIRRGDDGLSGRLDGITFSKWRNESIKAYGNAVVPQVVYEIFKAIQEYEKL